MTDEGRETRTKRRRRLTKRRTKEDVEEKKVNWMTT